MMAYTIIYNFLGKASKAFGSTCGPANSAIREAIMWLKMRLRYTALYVYANSQLVEAKNTDCK